ncbi:AzlC family ABC transporter permease [Geomonas sp. Red69]|uniref:AzlC family ABC transporter permease n=1 Tax=Geomonas diazotrophica TaxID=2843197 RepID=A0ABX8JKA4_9BACT|nr:MULTISPECIES: AzlC family ABC transporter permease [Geomonas]MBU5635192.1 AzlC family ABC transporter permease [Geomonas diazotrophica]QWV97747.1 AzlC family ABC transporter permease [Geomonas nitrogeniifigens]QXE86884.1 AzlC family ABC transporter permease [Geomonas nitrogeniifigens]
MKRRKPEMIRGARANVPVAASAMAYGSVLGVLAAQKGLSWLDMMYMNTAIFAGAAQFVMVDMWSNRLPLFEMTLAVLVINLRYLLIGASLDPLFSGRGLLHKMGMMHLVADENWAVTMSEQRNGSATTWFLFGGGVFLYLAWSSGTLIGLLGGGFITRPEEYALDFAFTAVFTALAVGLWRGKSDVLPWIAAGCVALLAHKFLPGKWYIVAGGLAGAVSAMLGPCDSIEVEEVEDAAGY